MKNLDIIGSALKEVTKAVRLGWVHKQEPPYICYLPYDRKNFNTDNIATQQKIAGTVHLFSQNAQEPLVKKVNQALNKAECAWSAGTIQQESDTMLWHFEWDFEVSSYGEI